MKRQERNLIIQSDIRTIQLGILDYINEIARRNDLQYTLSGGSLLGAVRHGGYIPWDDDIDLELPRSDYDKLMHLLSVDQSPQFALSHHSMSELTYRGFAKVYDRRTSARSKADPSPDLGVFVDIFPIDNLPDLPRELQLYRQQVDELVDRLKYASQRGIHYAVSLSSRKKVSVGKSAINAVLHLPKHLRFRGEGASLHRDLDDLSRKYQFQRKSWTANLVTPPQYRKVKFPQEIWSEFENVRFEDRVARKVRDHDCYLSAQYGDWRTPPPVEEQNPPHQYYAFSWRV